MSKSFPSWITSEKNWSEVAYQPLVTKEKSKETMGKAENNRVLQVFLNADLRCSHDGLREIAKKGGLDVKDLQAGQYIVFLNAAKDRLKLYAAGNVVAYMKQPDRGKIDPRMIAELPRAFNGTAIQYEVAIKEALVKIFARRGRRLESAE
jgi:hypothetical protein